MMENRRKKKNAMAKESDTPDGRKRRSTRQSKLSEQSVKEAEKAGKEDRKGRKPKYSVSTGESKSNPDIRYSISNIFNEGKNYGVGVVLDTNIFDGVKPRNWSKVLSQFVYENLAGKSIETTDTDGNIEVISFAKNNERVLKI